MEKVITEEMREFFYTNGYVVVKNAVPKQQCDAVIETIWSFTGQNPDDADSWYQPPTGMDTFWKHQNDGMIPLYNHQSLWDNRQHPRLYQAFAQLLDESKLWVSMDRVNMKPPVREGQEMFDHGFIHWDADSFQLSFPLPRPRRVQGVLYLADTEANQGGFQCVPSIYRDFEQWIASQPADRNPYQPDTTGHEVVPIPGGAGDLLIWDYMLAHGNGKNYNTKPRFAQYITMSPAPQSGGERTADIECWRERKGPAQMAVDPRGWEAKMSEEPAQLTPLGRKLLSLDPW